MPFPRKAAPAAVLALLASILGAFPAPSSAREAAPAIPAPSAASAAPVRAEEVYRAPATGTGAPAATSASPAPSDAVQEKFRRLQKEMSGPGERPATAGSANPAGTARQADPEPVGILSFSLKLLLGLTFVLVLAVMSIRMLKRLQGRMLSRPSADGTGGDLFEVMETCHLGTQQRVVALRILDEVGILGVTPQGISLLTVLKQPADEVRRARIGSGNPAAFSDSLNRILDRFKKPKRVGDLLNESKIG